MERSVSSGVVLLLVVGLVLTPIGSTIAAGQSSQSQPAPDNTVTQIQVFANGTARWTIQVRTQLETEAELEQFEQFQERLRANETSVIESFQERISGVVRTAANETGRSMTAVNFTITSSIQEVPRRWGIVSYEFTWTGFAASNGDTLVVGDVFQGGFFLAEDDRLVIAPPEGYRIVNSTPPPDSMPENMVAWSGRRDFSDGHPRVVIQPDTSTPTDGIRAPTTGMMLEGTTRSAELIPAGIQRWINRLAVLALLALFLLLIRRRGIETAHFGPDGDGQTRAETGGGPITLNEERVRSILQENGGQLRQSEITERMDWSASKTSRILSGMAQEGVIEKLQIGRENVIRLQEQPTDEE